MVYIHIVFSGGKDYINLNVAPNLCYCYKCEVDKTKFKVDSASYKCFFNT